MSVLIASVNVVSASIERARVISEWLPTLKADVIVMTELTTGKGSELLKKWFERQGWIGVAGEFTGHERGVAIYTRLPFSVNTLRPENDFLPARGIAIDICDENDRLTIVGMYIPTWGNNALKLDRKLEYMKSWSQHLVLLAKSSNCLLIGDLNLVPKEQKPKLFPQLPVEYKWLHDLELNYTDVARATLGAHDATWIAPSGEGYTFDHAFITNGFKSRIDNFVYLHESRLNEVSDHSVILVELDVSTSQGSGYLKDMPLIPIQQSLF